MSAASKEILDAIEKVYSGAWHCKRAEEETPGEWSFTLVDTQDQTERSIEGVAALHALPFLRDMLAHAEVGMDTGKSS